MGEHADEPHAESVGRLLNRLRASVLGANDGIVSVAGIVMGFLVLPTIATVAEDAMSSVPASLRDGASASLDSTATGKGFCSYEEQAGSVGLTSGSCHSGS